MLTFPSKEVEPFVISNVSEASVVRKVDDVFSSDETIFVDPDNVIFPDAEMTFFVFPDVIVALLIVPEPEIALTSGVANDTDSCSIDPPAMVKFDDPPNPRVGVASVLHMAMSEKYFGPTSFFDPKSVVATPEMSLAMKITFLDDFTASANVAASVAIATVSSLATVPAQVGGSTHAVPSSDRT